MSNWGTNHFVVEGINGKNLYEKIMDSIDKCIEFDKRYKIDKVNGNTYTIEKTIRDNDDRVEYDIVVWEGDQIDGHKYPIVWSWFYLSDVKFENECLFLIENFCRGWGGIEKYILDTKLYESGFYYYSVSESNQLGSTNDKNQKYFRMQCYILDIDSKELKEIREEREEVTNRFYPDNFDEWDIEKRISYQFEISEEDREKYNNEIGKIDEKYESKYNELEKALKDKYIPKDFDDWTFEKKLSYCKSHSENLVYITTTICEFVE
jgi:hypothetical protein